MPYNVEFGVALQSLRLSKNHTQSELAKLSGLDRTFISLIERGIRQPTFSTIVQLAHGLKIKPSELVIAAENRIRRTRWSRLKR